MRSLSTFILYLAACLLLAALLAYPLDLLLDRFTEARLHKIVGRTWILLALLGLAVFLRRMGLASKAQLGYDLPRRRFLAELARGLPAGIGILLVLCATLFIAGVHVPDPDATPALGDFLLVVMAGLVGGLAVGFIEETYFRGALFSAIRRERSATAAILLSSVLYAAVHFVKPQALPPGVEVPWYGGLWSVALGLGRIADPGNLDSFLALVMAGIFLALVRQRTGNIAACIGLHAGWVLVIKLFKHYTDRAPQAEFGFLVGGYDGVIGYLAATWLVLLSGAYLVWYSRRRSRAS